MQLLLRSLKHGDNMTFVNALLDRRRIPFFCELGLFVKCVEVHGSQHQRRETPFDNQSVHTLSRVRKEYAGAKTSEHLIEPVIGHSID